MEFQKLIELFIMISEIQYMELKHTHTHKFSIVPGWNVSYDKTI